MSRKERAIAALLLAVAVIGGALIPRLLASPSAPLGIALGPGPGRSVVQAPALPKAPRHRSARLNVSPQTAVQPSPVLPSVPAPAAHQNSAPPAKPPIHPPSPPSPPSAPPPPPSPPPPSPPPPTTNPSPPPKLMPLAPTRPGNGYGDKNHTHTGPRGHSDRPATAAKPARRSHGADLPGSGHGRKAPQAPPHAVGAHHRGVGHMAAPASAAAAHAHEARPKARPKARGPRGEGRHGAHPPQQVTHGHSKSHDGHASSGHGHSNGHQTQPTTSGQSQSTAVPPAPAPTSSDHGQGNGNGQQGQGGSNGNGHGKGG